MMAGFALNMDYPIAAIDQHQRESVEHRQMRGRILSRPLLKRREERARNSSSVYSASQPDVTSGLTGG
jgi:hypothetical protein